MDGTQFAAFRWRSMKPACIGISLALVGCGSQSRSECEALRTTESVLNELAWSAEQADAGRTPRTYLEAFQRQGVQQLKQSAQELRPHDPTAAGIVDGVAGYAGTPDRLRAAARSLRAREATLEAA